MTAYPQRFWRSLCLIALCTFSMQLHAARDDDYDDEFDDKDGNKDVMSGS